MQKNCSADKGVFCADVRSNEKIGRRFYRLGLEFSGQAAKAFAKTSPGQFAQLHLRDTALPPKQLVPEELLDASQRDILLRRPFSFCDVTTKDDKTSVDILYCVLGPATLRMTTLSPGDSVSLIGPLGSGFYVPKNKKFALLVAGGMGAPPLLHLAKLLTEDYPHIKALAFVGAKTQEELLLDAEPAGSKIEQCIATDDGSAGVKGLVTNLLEKWLSSRKPLAAEDMIIYSCGPEVMLAKVAKIAQNKNIDCQVSMERRMACGIGLCQSCAVECKAEDSNETVYKLCCKDGPVFNSREIVF
ncbi:MAG: dihydroorotate dehydrogenase electron transfer subunit [Planctomycetota bacterium]|jgi:dihydroorotate dehydrogenase electron transfer subunit